MTRKGGFSYEIQTETSLQITTKESKSIKTVKKFKESSRCISKLPRLGLSFPQIQ